MTDKTLTEDDDDDLVVVEVDKLPADTPEPKTPETPQDQSQDDPDEDDHYDDDDDGEDERLAEDAEDDPDGDTETNPKRRKRLKRRRVQRMAREATQRELQLLRSQNEAMAKRLAAVEGNALSQNELALEARLAEAQRAVGEAEMIIARAIEAGNGEDVAAALKLRDEGKTRVAQLEMAKHQVTTAKTAPPAANPAVVNYAQDWMQANPWYDPQGRNEDSAVTNAIDARLVAEGYDPANVQYWQELTKRVKARLGTQNRRPEADDADDVNEAPRAQKKKAPPMGATREHAPQSTKKEVYVTPERKQAMIEAGSWDDPVKRTRMLKAYQAYDRNAAR